MREDKINLSAAEWYVCESLWEGAPKIGSRIVADLQESIGWSRSTTLTMLRRMTEKGIIACRDIQRVKAYFPLVNREAAVRKESQDFLERVYHGDVVALVDSFVKMKKLSNEDIEQLRELLRKAEVGR